MKSNSPKYFAAISAFALMLGLTSTAQAAEETGTVAAEVVSPMQIELIDDLRFGTILRPTSSGSLTISSFGNVSATGGVNGNYAIPQPPNGRGPAKFLVHGTPNRLIYVVLPSSINIGNGSVNMLVDLFRANTFFGFGLVGPSGTADLNIGGRLNVGAAQPTGSYSGTFEITVFYL